MSTKKQFLATWYAYGPTGAGPFKREKIYVGSTYKCVPKNIRERPGTTINAVAQ